MNGRPQFYRGFTLIELLVVIAVILILAAILLPALARAKAQAQQTSCLSNKKQMQMAWHMYTGDFNDNMPTCGATSIENDFGWCSGWMTNVYDATNYLLLENSNAVLWPYLTSVGVYKCPSDTSIAMCYVIEANGVFVFANEPFPRVRSISMNGWMNGNAGSLNTDNPEIITYHKTKDLTRPGPSQTYVFTDEMPATLDDDYFQLLATEPDYWGVWPGIWHNGGDCFSYADGHAEYHKWVDAPTLLMSAATMNPYVLPNGACPDDVYWAELHATALVNPATPYPPMP